MGAILAIAVLISLATFSHFGTSGVLIYPSNIDAGEILQGSEKQVKVTLYNSTTEGVQIAQIEPSCGCVSATVSSNEIPRKTSTSVKIVVAPGYRVGSFMTFALIEGRYLRTNRPFEAKVNIYYKAVRLVETDPLICDFGDIDWEQGGLRIVKIFRGDASLRWNKMLISTSRLNIICHEDQSGEKVIVQIPPCRYPIGPLHDQFTVRLLRNRQLVGQSIIPLKVRITSDVRPEPSSIFVGVIKQNVVKRGFFQIDCHSHYPVRLISISGSSSEFITIKFLRSTESELYFSYETNVTKGLGPQSGNILITISTNKPKVVSVPYLAFVK